MQEQRQKQFPGLGKIYAGQIHYSRIPVQYWEHRIKMLKALGLNALSIYIMWNYHELSKGQYDYKSDNKNLPLFLDLAQKHNMMVLFRPGPYVCAEWDFGGMPARLLSVDGLVLRANNKQFLDETRIYFKSLAPIMKKYLRNDKNPKGCIVMLQIENEYGFYGTDKTYMQQIRAIWKSLDISVHQYYVDWLLFIKRCHWEGANIGINHFDGKMQQMRVRMFEKKGVILGGQIYTGWMTHWTEKWGGKGIEKVYNNFKFLLQNGNSFAMYVAHGGTNFGLTAGANGLKAKSSDYWGAITSYDYDAPVNQQGSVTQKYMRLRELIKQHAKWQVPQIPEPIEMISINQIKLQRYSRMLDNISKQVVVSQNPLPFQSKQLKMFNQGIVLYQTKLSSSKKTYIKMVVHDFALVFLGNKVIQVLDRTKQTNHGFTISQQDIQKYGVTLRVLVQASGHINFDKNMQTDRKGIYSFGGDTEKLFWKMYKFPVEYSQIVKYKPNQKWNQSVLQEKDHPILLKGNFFLQKTGDVYLDLNEYGKGYVWVNGRNLGRYWNKGPQTRLFCPGVWLKQGSNQIYILNVWGPYVNSLQGFKTLRDPLAIEQKTCNIM